LIHSVRLDYSVPGEDLAAPTVVMPRLALSRRQLRELLSALRLWLDQPLDALLLRTFHYKADLIDGPAESLIVNFGRHEGLLIGGGQVGCLVELRYSALKTSLPLVTDPTCLEILADGLERVLYLEGQHAAS